MMLQIINIYIPSHCLYRNDRISVIKRQRNLFIPWQLISTVCMYLQKKKISSRLRRQHTSFPYNQLLYLLLGCHTPYFVNLCYWLLSQFSFSTLLPFLVFSSTFLPPSLSSSFSTAQKCAKLTAPSLPLVTVAFPSHPSQFLCIPHIELVVRGDTKLRGSSGEAIEFAAIALGDQTCVVHVRNTHRCWQSEERKAPIVFLSCSRLSQWYFCSLCLFCLKLCNSQEVSSYKRLLRK